MAFIGIARLEVLHGKVSVGGSILSASSSTRSSALIFSPRCSPLPTIKALPSPSDVNDSPPEPQEKLPLDTSKFAAIVVLHPHTDSGVQHIGKACPLAGSLPFEATDDGSAASSAAAQHMQLGVDGVTLVYQETRHVRCQQDIPEWEEALQHITQDLSLQSKAEPAIVLVRGQKRVGKSSFARRALHRLLATREHTRVAFLDLDLGQSEFGPPGMVALHVFDGSSSATLSMGPSWCTLRTPVRAHYVGDISPSDAPREYMDAVFHLIEYFREGLQSAEETDGAESSAYKPRRRARREAGSEGQTRSPIPLVVNTMGWVKGLGADLLSQIEDKLNATHIVDFLRADIQHDEAMTAAAEKPLVSLVPLNASFSEAFTQLARVYSVPPFVTSANHAKLTAADNRTLCLMSYLYKQTIPGSSAADAPYPKWCFDEPLLAIPPYIVDIKTGFPGGVHVLPFGSAVQDSLKLQALDVSIAAIVTVQPEAALNALDFAGRADTAPPHRTSHCLGLALVRAVDERAGTVELLTPIEPARLLASAHSDPQTQDQVPDQPQVPQALALVKGAIQVPVWAFLDFELVRAAKDGTLSAYSRNGYMIGGKVPISQMPYLSMPSETVAEQQQQSGEGAEGGASALPPPVIGGKKRRIRKNLMRRSQQQIGGARHR